jgi:hypothetical protein
MHGIDHAITASHIKYIQLSCIDVVNRDPEILTTCSYRYVDLATLDRSDMNERELSPPFGRRLYNGNILNVHSNHPQESS